MKRSWTFTSDEVGSIMARHVAIETGISLLATWSVSAQMEVKGAWGGTDSAKLTGMTVTLEDETA